MITGTRLTLSVPSNVSGQSDISVFSSFEEVIDGYESDTFLITAPMYCGDLYPLHPGDRVVVQYVTDKAFFEADALVIERVRKEGLDYVSLKGDSYVRRIQRRNDFRMDVLIESDIVVPAEDDPSFVPPGTLPHKCTIVNLSGGGVALYCSLETEIGAFLQLAMPEELFGADKRLISQVHWIRKTDLGMPYKFMLGMRFVFGTPGEKEALVRYTFEKQRKQLKKDQGV